MKFNDLKRKAFFWIDKLQISRAERISVTLLLALLAILFSLNFFINQTFQFSQEKYDAITAEFERRSAALHEERKKVEEKYYPEATVKETPADETEHLAEPEKKLPAASITQKININTATATQLQTLNGIGEAYARRIIEYREANGGFDSIDELTNVKGIGEKRLENIRPFITLDD